eukprot:gb/GFBE01012089.1/.p1 GENE.gb/GFBE01012089.1/~~gb/GFBE01012089.1/.p1  ORF type:complete len:134 (+),score=14.58 gb/GFBE01012089.1/:1-402(+)
MAAPLQELTNMDGVSDLMGGSQKSEQKASMSQEPLVLADIARVDTPQTPPASPRSCNEEERLTRIFGPDGVPPAPKPSYQCEETWRATHAMPASFGWGIGVHGHVLPPPSADIQVMLRILRGIDARTDRQAKR